MKNLAAWALVALQAISLAYLASLDHRISNVEHILMERAAVALR